MSAQLRNYHYVPSEAHLSTVLRVMSLLQSEAAISLLHCYWGLNSKSYGVPLMGHGLAGRVKEVTVYAMSNLMVKDLLVQCVLNDRNSCCVLKSPPNIVNDLSSSSVEFPITILQCRKTETDEFSKPIPRYQGSLQPWNVATSSAAVAPCFGQLLAGTWVTFSRADEPPPPTAQISRHARSLQVSATVSRYSRSQGVEPQILHLAAEASNGNVRSCTVMTSNRKRSNNSSCDIHR